MSVQKAIKSQDGIRGRAVMTVMVFLPPGVSSRQRLFALARSCSFIELRPNMYHCATLASPLTTFRKDRLERGPLANSSDLIPFSWHWISLGKRGWRDGRLTCQTATLPWPLAQVPSPNCFLFLHAVASLDSVIPHQKEAPLTHL